MNTNIEVKQEWTTHFSQLLDIWYVKDELGNVLGQIGTDKEAAESKKYADKIVTAVNNTYGKGINPNAVEDMLNALREFHAANNARQLKVAHGMAENAIQKATL